MTLTEANALPRVAPVFCIVYPHSVLLTAGDDWQTAAAVPIALGIGPIPSASLLNEPLPTASAGLLTAATEPFSVAVGQPAAGCTAYVGKPDRAVSPMTGDII